MLFLNIFDRIDNSLSRVKHITAFAEEDTLKLILVCLIVGFTAASGVVLFMILLRRTISINHTIRRKKLVEKYENFLAESITYFYENDKLFETKSFSVTLNKKDQTHAFNRSVLREQILLMKKHVGGEDAKSLFELYEKLKFDKAAIKKLNSWHWNTRLEALQELTAMESKSANTLFQKMTNDRNAYVRIAAIKALILRGGYLHTGQAAWQPSLIRYSYDLSAWEQSQIFDALSRHQDIQLPNFAPLLYSFNPTVVLFGLRMIKYFHCMDAVSQVIPFLKSENPLIVKAVEEVLVQFDHTIENESISLSQDALLLTEKPATSDLSMPKMDETQLNALLSFDEMKLMMDTSEILETQHSKTIQAIDLEKLIQNATVDTFLTEKSVKRKTFHQKIQRQTKITRSRKNLKNPKVGYHLTTKR